jgi:NhaP-type Na+/H+ or K+/H+ antiporter
MAIAGALCLSIALSAAYLRRLPITISGLYLLLGVVLGPRVLHWLDFSVRSDTSWFQSLTQVAVIVSLFVGGLKLRLPFRAKAWRTVPWLVGPIMLLTIVGLTLFAHAWLHMDAAFALLLGAILAPTDPVLASAVSVSDAGDRDRMRYGLSGEAGLNDGLAFPFVVFAVAWIRAPGPGAWLGPWLVVHVLWATPVALGIGFTMGKQVGQLAAWLRTRHHDRSGPTEFLALALIALSYVFAEWVSAWGFLAVFAAGVGLRRAEREIVRRSPHPEVEPEREHPPAEDIVPSRARRDHGRPSEAVGSLVAETLAFGETAERLFELTLVVLIGAALSSHWDARAIPIAAFLFVLLRPLATQLALARTPTTVIQRWLMGWFGVRGIGSLYYLAYALAAVPRATEVANITLSVVALSIIVHGVSAHSLLALYERSLRKRAAKRKAYEARLVVKGPPA